MCYAAEETEYFIPLFRFEGIWLIIGLISALICFVTGIIVLIDMFRQIFKEKVWIDLTFLFLLPFVPFYWVRRKYSGNRMRRGSGENQGMGWLPVHGKQPFV